ncbi:hypothetical protein BTVI_150501 [Pitangus sulphuratus]|nr:hypothetical protein BTVI_150501 [Pitangus sulphuratus]
MNGPMTEKGTCGETAAMDKNETQKVSVMHGALFAATLLHVALSRTGWGSEEGVYALDVREHGECMEFCLGKDDEPDERVQDKRATSWGGTKRSTVRLRLRGHPIVADMEQNIKFDSSKKGKLKGTKNVSSGENSQNVQYFDYFGYSYVNICKECYWDITAQKSGRSALIFTGIGRVKKGEEILSKSNCIANQIFVQAGDKCRTPASSHSPLKPYSAQVIADVGSGLLTVWEDDLNEADMYICFPHCDRGLTLHNNCPLKYVIIEALPLWMMGLALASGGSILVLAGIG